MPRLSLSAAALLLCLAFPALGQGKKAEPAKASEELQEKRKDLLRKLQKEGLVKKLETPGTTPRLWVTPKFMRLDFDAKKGFAELAFAYAYEVPKETKAGDLPADWGLNLYHTQTGKRVGTYYPMLGLEMD